METATAAFCAILVSIFGSSASAGYLNIGSLIKGKHFENCLVHVITQGFRSDSLDYSSFSNPVGIDSGQYRSRRIPNWLAPPFLYSGGKHEPSDQLRYLRCLLTLVIVDRLPGSLSKINHFLFDQRYTFRHNSDAYFVLLGYYILISRSLPKTLVEAVKQEIKLFAHRISYMQDFPMNYFPVFWLPLGTEATPGISGWFSCTYCAKSKQYTPFYCTDLSDCSESMVNAYEDASEGGKGVEWRMTKGRRRVFPTFISLPPCPLTLGQHGDCIQNEPDNFFNFLFQGLNESLLQENAKLKADGVGFINPRVVRDEFIKDSWPIYFMATGQRYELRFITSHGVAQNDLSVGILLCPFQRKVWLALAVAMVSFSLALAGLKNDGVLPTVGENFHCFVAMCLEQYVLGKVLRGTSFKVAPVIMLSSWLIFVVVVVNVYKATLKSTYMLEPSYETYMKHLRDLQGFQLYFIHKFPWYNASTLAPAVKRYEAACKSWNERRPDIGNRLDCKAEFYRYQCGGMSSEVQEVSLCSAMASFDVSWRIRSIDYWFANDNEKYRKWVVGYYNLTRGLLQHTRARDPDALNELVANELKEPKTALVVPRERFDTIWKQVKGAMVATGAKLANNRDTDSEGLLSISLHYGISSGFVATPGHKNIFVFRAKVLTESGIYRLWIEWEQFRKIWEQPKVEYPSFVALSLTNSDVGVIFILYIYCVCVCVVAVTAEMVSKMVCSSVRSKYFL